jgi:hypothetical protein
MNMNYRIPKSTPLALKRLNARVDRNRKAREDAANKEPEDAFGTMMTQIDCPACDDTFDMEGDRDGEIINCQNCNTPLRIRRM